MIMSADDAQCRPEFAGVDAELITHRLAAIEASIRARTRNNFQIRACRFHAESIGNKLIGPTFGIAVGDTVEIDGAINSGLFSVEAVSESALTVTPKLYDWQDNLVTLVRYPPDVIEGALAMLQWDIERRGKAGIKAETLSRHSVSYADADLAGASDGYPPVLLGFLKPYMKAGF